MVMPWLANNLVFFWGGLLCISGRVPNLFQEEFSTVLDLTCNLKFSELRM